jgi:hypothetical protein
MASITVDMVSILLLGLSSVDNGIEQISQQEAKNMRTELRKSFTHGFVLTEQELRRIHNKMMQQMKSHGKDNFSSYYELRYKNGVRAEKASLDEIIADDNSGKSKIQGLKMALLSRSPIQETQIEIEFRVPPPTSKDVDERSYSIQYYVVGDERDWVYLTSSELDDRIANIKQLPIFNYGVTCIVIGMLILCFVAAYLISNRFFQLLLGYRIILCLVPSLLIIGGIAAVYGFPLYNFCWGDYIKFFSRRQTLGKYVLSGVIITLVLGIIGSVIATLFFIK